MKDTRIIRIDNCSECPYHYESMALDDLGNIYCQLMKPNLMLPEIGIHPDCPLEKEKEEAK